MKQVLIVSDNAHWMSIASSLVRDNKTRGEFEIVRSRGYCDSQGNAVSLRSDADVGDPEEAKVIADCYDLVLSLHCQRIFHKNLTDGTLCINLHPGILPGGRGWNPYVFAMAYRGAGDAPAGATIHVMDELIDHGPIIATTIVPLESMDTCDTLYERVLEAEEELIAEWLPKILDGEYRELEGTQLHDPVRTKKDYEELCCLDLDQLTSRQLLRRLAALTYRDQKNAYFLDSDMKKIHVGVFFGEEV